MLIEHLGIALMAVAPVLIFLFGWRPAAFATLTAPLIFSIPLIWRFP